jgi:hypothetical protein
MPEKAIPLHPDVAPNIYPGVATPANRLNGRYGIATVAGFTLTLVDWEVEIRTEFVDATAHGDIWDIPVPLKYLWTARLRGFYHVGDATYLHAAYSAQITGSPPPDIGTVSFIGYRDDVPTNIVFSGSGYVVRSHWSSPQAMVEQELELRGVGIPASIP